MDTQYNNDITDGLVAQLKAPYSMEEMALMEEEPRAIFAQHTKEMILYT